MIKKVNRRVIRKKVNKEKPKETQKSLLKMINRRLSSVEGIKAFQKVKLDSFNSSQKSVIIRKQLRFRHFYKLSLRRRLFFVQLKSKKKKVYRFNSLVVGKERKSFKRLLKIYSRNFIRFVKKREKVKKRLKGNLRRRKRKTKWRRRGLFRLFRTRYSFKHKFSIPRHFETNYKTGTLIYLGFHDANSYNFRLPFPLNIRKLVTFMSS